ncbi:GNAT family N-acetyltransferase (plasmid) [Roseomonas gilardii subsp. gilardii]|uniref:GNAT family N-acetyltransferase n=1 Tax=Roseomonas gilardii TaxID=257708 RepID=UPI001FFA15CB|nr:GNAT family N-acetyltransferase [Roseomonas gilardii]UPG74563.1 GNAT family N-acetyltransferase [Roseomonas gilardii subsp. gilardii]
MLSEGGLPPGPEGGGREPGTGLRAGILPGIHALPRESWEACLPGEAEDWAYHAACEAGAMLELRTGAAAVQDGHGLVAAVPLFRMSYRLDTPLQEGSGRLGRGLSRLLRPVAEMRLLAVGSPFTERCHLALRPGLTAERQAAALRALLGVLEVEARAARASLLAFKDLDSRDAARLAPVLEPAGFQRIPSLPVAVLDLEAGGMEAYLASLSAGTRKDLRRKLRGAGAVRIEHREHPGDCAAAIEGLYEATRRQSGVHYGPFEELPRDYFRSIAEALPGRVRFVLYWVGQELAAFNLLLLERGRVIDKFLGMAYPLARQHNLYAVSWVENVRFALETGRRLLQSGQTAYASKLRFGSRLEPSAIFVRHRNPVLNRGLRLAAPWLAFDRWDPDLRDPGRYSTGRG